MRLLWSLILAPAGLATTALADPLELALECRGETSHVVFRRGGAVTDSFKHDPNIYLSGENAIITWKPGGAKEGRVIATPQKFFLVLPDPPLGRGARLVSKEASIDRVTGVFTDVTEVENGRQRERVEHTSTCEQMSDPGQRKF